MLSFLGLEEEKGGNIRINFFILHQNIFVMRKLLLLSLVMMFGLFGTSCSDDNTDDVMIGLWKADKISFDGETYDYTNELITQGCETDYLTIARPGWASLQKSIKNDEGDCEEEIIKGLWDTTYVYFSGNPRKVITSHKHRLVLSYTLEIEGEQKEVTVTYIKE